MTEHKMSVEIVKYEKQYGYGQNSRLVCSCGETTPWGAGRGEGLPEAHRQKVIEEKLGLSFTAETIVVSG